MIFFGRIFLYMSFMVYYVAMPMKREYIKEKLDKGFSHIKSFDQVLSEFQSISKIK